MVVNISTNVLERINDYAIALTCYPISSKRAHEKVDKMIAALTGLGSSICIPPICVHKDLGQRLDSRGNPIDKNLRRFNYKDESGFQWAFACSYCNESNTITITKMLAASLIKETVESIMQPILEFAKRLSKIR